MPYNSVAQMQPKPFKIWIEINIKRIDLAIFNIIACLPANTSFIGKYPRDFVKYRQHFHNILFYAAFSLIFFSDIIWRRRYD